MFQWSITIFELKIDFIYLINFILFLVAILPPDHTDTSAAQQWRLKLEPSSRRGRDLLLAGLRHSVKFNEMSLRTAKHSQGNAIDLQIKNNHVAVLLSLVSIELAF